MSLNERGPPVPPERASKSDQSQAKDTPAKPRLSSVPLDDFEIDAGFTTLVPPGRYSVAFVDWWTGKMFGKAQKIALRFTIMDMGDHFGKSLTRWYNARRLIGKYGLHGRFQVGRGSDFLADYVRLLGMPARTDRISLMKLRHLIISADVEIVQKNHEQKSIIEPLQYSVIRRLVSIECGNSEQKI